jgi:hypothetical protein
LKFIRSLNDSSKWKQNGGGGSGGIFQKAAAAHTFAAITECGFREFLGHPPVIAPRLPMSIREDRRILRPH